MHSDSTDRVAVCVAIVAVYILKELCILSEKPSPLSKEPCIHFERAMHSLNIAQFLFCGNLGLFFKS